MSRLDGSHRSVLVWDIVDPRAIVLDPAHGYVFTSAKNICLEIIVGFNKNSTYEISLMAVSLRAT